jgi:precorrin-8X/cobalt-precorrin-8 methylmutase
MGAHVQKDLPNEIEAAMKKHPGVKTRVTRNLGFHDKLIDIVIERIGENGGAKNAKPQEPVSHAVPATTHPIEEESMRIIEERLGLADALGFGPSELAVVKRVIHTTADFEFKDLMRFSTGAVKAGVEAVRNGCNIITDVKMVRAGVPTRRLDPFGCNLFCFSSDPDVIKAATLDGMTRTAASMKKASGIMAGAIVAIGNAPTALRELIAMIERGEAAPALVVGVPVGFVGAAEAKEELTGFEIEYITSIGNKGGSTVAAAIVNAIAIIAGNRENPGGG